MVQKNRKAAGVPSLSVRILSRIGRQTSGRLPVYAKQVTLRLAEGVAGHVEAGREARCRQKRVRCSESLPAELIIGYSLIF